MAGTPLQKKFLGVDAANDKESEENEPNEPKLRRTRAPQFGIFRVDIHVRARVPLSPFIFRSLGSEFGYRNVPRAAKSWRLFVTYSWISLNKEL